MVYDPSKFLLGPLDLTGMQMKISAIRNAGNVARQHFQHRDQMALARDQQQLDRERMEANQDYQQQLLEHQRMQAAAKSQAAQQKAQESKAKIGREALQAAANGEIQKFEFLNKTHGLGYEYIPESEEIAEQPAPPPVSPSPQPPPPAVGLNGVPAPPPVAAAGMRPSQATMGPPPAPRTAPGPRPNTSLLPAAALAAAAAAPQGAQAAPMVPQQSQPPPQRAPQQPPPPAVPFPVMQGQASAAPPPVTMVRKPARVVGPGGINVQMDLFRKQRAARIIETYSPIAGSFKDDDLRKAATDVIQSAARTGDTSLLDVTLKQMADINGDHDKAKVNLLKHLASMEAQEQHRDELNFNRGAKLVDTYIKKDDLKTITGLKELRQADEMFATGNPALQMRAVTVRRNSLESGVMTEPDYQKNTGMLDWFEQAEQKLGWGVGALRNWWNNGILPEGVKSDDEATKALVDTKVFLPPTVLKRMRAAIGKEIEIQKPMAEQIIANAEERIRTDLPEDSSQRAGALSVLRNLRKNIGIIPGEGTPYEVGSGGEKYAWAEQYRNEVEQAAEEEGIPASVLFDIMKGEGSKGRLDAKGKKLDNGGRGFGLFQINTGAHDDFDVERAENDPLYQAQYAARLLKKKIKAAGGDLRKAVGFWGSTGSPEARETYINNVKKHWSPETREMVLGEDEAAEAAEDLGEAEIADRVADGDISVDEATDLALEAF